MAVSGKWYGQAFISAFNKEIDFDTDVIKVALVTSTYTPNQDTHRYFSSVTNEVANGSGYTSGGAVLGSAAIAYDGGSNTFKLSGSSTSWVSSTITARYAVIYDSTPATNKPLLAYVDFGQNVSSSNGTFQITWDSSGIAVVTVN